MGSFTCTARETRCSSGGSATPTPSPRRGAHDPVLDPDPDPAARSTAGSTAGSVAAAAQAGSAKAAGAPKATATGRACGAGTGESAWQCSARTRHLQRGHPPPLLALPLAPPLPPKPPPPPPPTTTTTTRAAATAFGTADLIGRAPACAVAAVHRAGVPAVQLAALAGGRGVRGVSHRVRQRGAAPSAARGRPGPCT